MKTSTSAIPGRLQQPDPFPDNVRTCTIYNNLYVHDRANPHNIATVVMGPYLTLGHWVHIYYWVS